MRLHTILRASTASLAVTLLMPLAAPAAARERIVYHLPAQSLADTLRAIATQSGRSIIAPAELVRGKAAAMVVGPLSVDEAIAAALTGSGLRARHVAGGFVVERPARWRPVATAPCCAARVKPRHRLDN